MRVAFVLRSAEVQPLFRDLCDFTFDMSEAWHGLFYSCSCYVTVVGLAIVISSPPPLSWTCNIHSTCDICHTQCNIMLHVIDQSCAQFAWENLSPLPLRSALSVCTLSWTENTKTRERAMAFTFFTPRAYIRVFTRNNSLAISNYSPKSLKWYM
jgi:hypothetical protein